MEGSTCRRVSLSRWAQLRAAARAPRREQTGQGGEGFGSRLGAAALGAMNTATSSAALFRGQSPLPRSVIPPPRVQSWLMQGHGATATTGSMWARQPHANPTGCLSKGSGKQAGSRPPTCGDSSLPPARPTSMRAKPRSSLCSPCPSFCTAELLQLRM